MVEILDNRAAADALPHMRYDRAQLILITGKRGYGKTTLIERYIEQREPRIFMLDPHDDFPQVPLAPSIESALRDLQEYPDACWRRVIPPWTDDDDADESELSESHAYGRKVFRMVNKYLRNCLVVYNEALLWTPPRAPKSLVKQITQGRRIGIKHIIDCQRFQYLPDVMRAEGSHLVVFHTSRFRDRQVISQESTPEIGDIAPRLEVGQCVVTTL